MISPHFLAPESPVGSHRSLKTLGIRENYFCCFPVIKGSSRWWDAFQAPPNGFMVVSHFLILSLGSLTPPITWNLFRSLLILHLILRRSCWDRHISPLAGYVCTWVITTSGLALQVTLAAIGHGYLPSTRHFVFIISFHLCPTLWSGF